MINSPHTFSLVYYFDWVGGGTEWEVKGEDCQGEGQGGRGEGRGGGPQWPASGKAVQTDRPLPMGKCTRPPLGRYYQHRGTWKGAKNSSGKIAGLLPATGK